MTWATSQSVAATVPSSKGSAALEKRCGVLAVRKAFASVRFDDGQAVLCLARDLHPIQRRPPPMF